MPDVTSLASGLAPATGAAASRVTTLISFADIVALLRHRITAYLSSDVWQESDAADDNGGWAFENLHYLPDGQIDVSEFLSVLLTGILSDPRSLTKQPSRLRESKAILCRMGLDDDQARSLTFEIFRAALIQLAQHLPQAAFNDRGEYDFLLTQLDLIAIRDPGSPNRTQPHARPHARPSSAPSHTRN